MHTPNRFIHTLALGALLLPAASLMSLAQPPAQPPGQPMPPATPKMEDGKQPAANDAAKNTYQARLIITRPETNQVVFQVRDGGSTRIYTMTLAEGAKLQSGGQDASLASFESSAAVTIATEKQGNAEKVVSITDAPADAKNLPMSPTDRDGPATGGKLSLAFPTGNRETSVLVLETSAPDEVRVGEGFDYQVKVTNVSQTLMLENVVVRQAASSKLDVNQGASTSQPAAPANADPKAAPAPQSPDQQSGRSGDTRWTVPALMPGQSVVLRAPAVAHAEGVVGSCFRVSYEPALCVRITAVKPSITLTKAAPELQRYCEGFQFSYVVKNTGTAVAKNVTVTEQLPKGLATTDGATAITLPVGDLAPGAEKSLQAPVLAAQRGEFTSKATAKGEGVAVESRATTTRVVDSSLTVNVEGPQSEYVSQEITYTATVKNDGDAPAPNATLAMTLDGGTRFVRSTPVDGGPAGSAAPAPDAAGKLAWNLGTLAPGETRKASVTVMGQKQGQLKATAIATSECARNIDTEKVATTTKTLQTEMLVVPALRLSLVDQSDLIKVGTEVVYTLQVINQGTGPDTNVSVKLNLPAQFEYIDSDGPSKGTMKDQIITFEAAKQLNPGEKLTWNIRAKAKVAEDVRTTAELNSDYLKQPVTTTEPTRLVK